RTPAKRARSAKRAVVWDYAQVLEPSAPALDLRPRNPRLYAVTDRAVRLTIKTLWQLGYDGGPGGTYADAQSMAMQLASDAGLLQWLDRCAPHWERAIDKMRASGDTRLA